MAFGYEKQETPQQGPAQHHRLLDIASSPRVLVSTTPALLELPEAEEEQERGCCAAEGWGTGGLCAGHSTGLLIPTLSCSSSTMGTSSL